MTLTTTFSSLDGTALPDSATTLYYSPAGSGQFQVTVQAGDEAPGHETAGIEQLTFPTIFGDDGQTFSPGGVTQTLPYTHTYTVVATQSLAMNRSVEAVDRAGNLGTSPLFRVAQDAGGPQLSAPGLAASASDPGYVYVAPGQPALYYAPAAEGELSVTVTATDTQSGLKSLTFPDVFAPGDGDERSLAGQHGPETFQHSYPFLGSQAVSGTFVVSATDQVDVPGQAQPFRVVQDAISPTAAITVPAVVPLEFQVAWGGQDSLSGVRDYDVQYRDALTPTWTAWLSGTTETQAPFAGERGRSYYFQVRATDLACPERSRRVSNTGAWTESLSVTVTAVTKYYYLGDQRVAMRQGDVVYYLHSDHLGSTSLTTDEDGLPVAEARYRPYGEERWAAGGAVSDYTFTGQRKDSFGLMDYRARHYDPYLGRFISADTLVPGFANPQALNRYAYTLGNPLLYVDPSGHCVPGVNCPGDKNDEVGGYAQSPPTSIPNVETGASPAFEVSVTRTDLGYYNPALPSTVGAINSAVGAPAGFATATYNLGRTSGNYLDYMPTMVNRIGYGATLALPLVNGAINASDINARERAGMISGNEVILEHTNNAAFTVLNVGTSWFMLEAATPTFTLSATSVGVPTILSSPVTIVAAIPSIGIVTAWEQQTISNMIEGVPREQAWKEARDTVYEPVLTLCGASRESHPEWYWYP